MKAIYAAEDLSIGHEQLSDLNCLHMHDAGHDVCERMMLMG